MVNLDSSDEDQIAWCEKQGITPHTFQGSIDDDCLKCGLSVYMAIHVDAFPRLDEGD